MNYPNSIEVLPSSFCKLLQVYRQLKLKLHLTWIIATSVTNHGSEHRVKHHSQRPPVTTGIIWLVFNYLKKSHNDNLKMKKTCGQHVATTNDLMQLGLLIDRFRLQVRLRED